MPIVSRLYCPSPRDVSVHFLYAGLHSDTETVLQSDWAKYFTNGFDAKGARAYESGLSRNAVDACHKAGIKHIIYSTLDTMPEQGIHCEHYESKADGQSTTPAPTVSGKVYAYRRLVTKYMKEKNIPSTQLYTSTYFSNSAKFGMI